MSLRTHILRSTFLLKQRKEADCNSNHFLTQCFPASLWPLSHECAQEPVKHGHKVNSRGKTTKSSNSSGHDPSSTIHTRQIGCNKHQMQSKLHSPEDNTKKVVLVRKKKLQKKKTREKCENHTTKHKESTLTKLVALRKLRAIVSGWSPSSTNGLAWVRNSPASNTTLVVPSPT